MINVGHFIEIYFDGVPYPLSSLITVQESSISQSKTSNLCYMQPVTNYSVNKNENPIIFSEKQPPIPPPWQRVAA